MQQITEFYLLKPASARDKLRQLVPGPARRKVLGIRSSVSGSEFTNVGILGIRAEMRLTVCSMDYEGETDVELDGVPYSVYRTYQPTVYTTELYLQKRVGDSP